MRKENIDELVSEVAVEEAEASVKQPPRYRVLLHNDDYTPMEFVVEVLQSFFNMDQELATIKMLEVHSRGKACCGSAFYQSVTSRGSVTLTPHQFQSLDQTTYFWVVLD